MKILGVVLTVFAVIILSISVYCEIRGGYLYERDFLSYWNLADKASTIAQKSEMVDKFVSALEAGGMTGEYNALVFKTPDNSFDKNLDAIKSLQKRLHEIETMDITSFQYQTAIQQITAQEQGEAKAMLQVFSGIWWMHNYFLLWNWVGAIFYILVMVLLTVGVILLVDDY